MHSDPNQRLGGLVMSPDGEWLAFCTRGGVEDIWMVPADGSHQAENLTNDEFKDRHLAWYPEAVFGSVLLTFASTRGGLSYHIEAIQPNGERETLTESLGTANTMQPDWFDGERLLVRIAGSREIYKFPDGPLRDPEGPVPANEMQSTIQMNAVWSRNRDRIAQTRGSRRALEIFSEDPDFETHLVLDENGNAYFVGSRDWLDNDRLIFWEADQRKAYLWDDVRREAREIDGTEETSPGVASEFAFSPNGDWLYRLRKTFESDIWVLELSDK
jgi:hypothetical protein